MSTDLDQKIDPFCLNEHTVVSIVKFMHGKNDRNIRQEKAGGGTPDVVHRGNRREDRRVVETTCKYVDLVKNRCSLGVPPMNRRSLGVPLCRVLL